MPDIKNDVRCQSIEKKLDFYAEKTRQWQIERSRYVKSYGNKFQFNNEHPYPYDDVNERRLINEIDSYLLSFAEEDRMSVNGHFLWKYRMYFSQPFAKHAIELASRSVMAHPLSDGDKVKFLEYLFSSGRQYDFDKRILFKLADYNPDKNPQITNRLYTKAMAYFDSSTRKDERYINLIYGMFNSFSQKIEQLSPDAVVNYARIYFKMADRTTKELSPGVIMHLVTKTPMAHYLAEITSDTGLDKDTMQQVFKAYAEHVKKSKEFNPRLGKQMQQMAAFVFDRYHYSLPEAEALMTEVRPAKTDENGRRLRSSKKSAAQDVWADQLQKFYLKLHDDRNLKHLKRRNPINGIDINDASFRPTDKLILDYAGYLFDYGAFNNEEEVSTETLEKMIKLNASVKGLDVVQPTLFSEGGRKKAVDKELVLKIASVYARSVGDTDEEFGNLNISLNRNMEHMLTDFAVHYGYTRADVTALTKCLAQGASGDGFFKKMGKNIVYAYTSAARKAVRGRDL